MPSITAIVLLSVLALRHGVEHLLLRRARGGEASGRIETVLLFLAYTAAAAAAVVLSWRAREIYIWIAAGGWAALGAGVLLRFWSRRALGRFYSYDTVIRDDHEMIDTGPYALCRHPLSAGMALEVLGLGLLGAAALEHYLSGAWLAAPLVVLLVTLAVRNRKEERKLIEVFGRRYQSYHRHVPGMNIVLGAVRHVLRLLDMPWRTCEEDVPPETMRRKFLRSSLGLAAAAAVGGPLYTLAEANWTRVRRATVTVPRLPAPFKGTTIALLTDIHHGPYTSLAYVNKVVRMTNDLSPDLILLGGDYVVRSPRYIAPCLAAHAALSAPLGVFGVLGNHDHWEDAPATKKAMKAAGIVELTNAGVWLTKGGARLRLAGMGDLWEDTQDLDAALGDTKPEETAILLSHNPDYVETITDGRVGLVLSGHTHGGQVVLPFVGAPLVPSSYGQKYLAGLVKAPHTQVFVSRGLGTIGPPVRFNCRPELVLITLE